MKDIIHNQCGQRIEDCKCQDTDVSILDENGLAACPFCSDFGAEVSETDIPNALSNTTNIHGSVTANNTYQNKWAVFCNTCFCEGPPCVTVEEARQSWNHRANHKSASTAPNSQSAQLRDAPRGCMCKACSEYRSCSITEA